jgi:biotin carboxyl carrier protein
MKVRVQVDGEIYDVEIGDLNSRPIQAVVAGELFAVWPEDVAGVVTTASTASVGAASEAGPLSRASVAPPGESAEELIVAPLPGDIVVVAVRVGESVDRGAIALHGRVDEDEQPGAQPARRRRRRSPHRRG